MYLTNQYKEIVEWRLKRSNDRDVLEVVLTFLGNKDLLRLQTVHSSFYRERIPRAM